MMRRTILTLAFAALALWGCASPRAAWVRQGFDQTCAARPAFAAAASANAADLDSLVWSPWGAEETGWRVYAPTIAAEVKTGCAPESQAFAAALARWQAKHDLVADGRMSPAVFAPMKALWQGRRGFVAWRDRGLCPDAPSEAGLVHITEDEPLMAKPILATGETAVALRRLRAAAAQALKLKPGDPTLAVFSGYRSPDYDAERCAREQNCNGVVRAQCSAHRTGMALDLWLGAAPGYEVDSSAAPNRLYQTGTPAYRWLVAHGRRYGFANYVFEPWHWKWAGR